VNFCSSSSLLIFLIFSVTISFSFLRSIFFNKYSIAKAPVPILASE